uniref:Uncharacterized protein n=1 Tax=Lepeophtheirus salmonis TaxID=72036 RepID=A0A0K2UJW3_LEPSM
MHILWNLFFLNGTNPSTALQETIIPNSDPESTYEYEENSSISSFFIDVSACVFDTLTFNPDSFCNWSNTLSSSRKTVFTSYREPPINTETSSANSIILNDFLPILRPLINGLEITLSYSRLMTIINNEVDRGSPCLHPFLLTG